MAGVVLQTEGATTFKNKTMSSKRRMDDAERLAWDYLCFAGFTSIEYEPDGNVPPDLLVDGKIAIEVRRLNQNFENIGNKRGLEEDAIPLRHRVERLLKEFGPPDDGRTWFVMYHFRRPLLPWTELTTHLRGFLKGFLSSQRAPRSHVELADCLEISVFEAASPGTQLFELGGFTDRNAGGWLLSELYRNLKLVIEEKSKKIEPYRSKYPIWWLLLADRITCGLAEHDQNEFLSIFTVQHNWDRIILLSPLNAQHAFVIQQH